MSYLEKLLKGVDSEWKPLKEVIDLEKGKQLNKEFLSETGLFPAYNGGISYSGFTDTYNYNEDTIIISQGGASAGYINFVTSKFYANAHCYVVLPKTELVVNRYVYHFLKKNQILLTSKQHGAGIPALKKSEILNISIPIPCPGNPKKSLEIQQKIVDILDRFTELKAKLEAELVARKQQFSYYREELLRFDENVVEHIPMGDENLGEFIRGKRFVKTDMIKKGVPTIHYGEMYTHYDTWADQAKSFVSRELVDRKKLRLAEKGDVIIVAAGETIEDIGQGTAWLGDEGVVIHDACFYYKSGLNPKYVAYFTRTRQFHDQIKKHIRTGKISAINAKGLGKAIIPIPSPQEQERIVSILDKFDVLTSSISEGLPKEIQLRKKQYEYYRNLLLDFPKEEIEV